VFYGCLQREKVIEIIQKSDFTIFARDVNRVTLAGFPTKLAESFSLGTPVVTNPTSNISKYIKQGKNGFVAEDCSIEALRIVILQALQLSNEDLIRMHQYCIEHNFMAIKNFTHSFDNFL
jgi:glycosyltransferase involved in cell wall biosynthesis